MALRSDFKVALGRQERRGGSKSERHLDRNGAKVKMTHNSCVYVLSSSPPANTLSWECGRGVVQDSCSWSKGVSFSASFKVSIPVASVATPSGVPPPPDATQ